MANSVRRLAAPDRTVRSGRAEGSSQPYEQDLYHALYDGPRRAGDAVALEAKGVRFDPETAEWRTSNRGDASADNCVEVAFADGGVAVRDSRHPEGPILLFTQAEWDAFVAGAKDGEFDLED